MRERAEDFGSKGRPSAHRAPIGDGPAGLSPRMSSGHGQGGGGGQPVRRRRTHRPPHGTPKEEEEEDNPYFASVGITTAKPSSPPASLPRPASPSRQSPSRRSPARQSPSRLSPARLSPSQLRSGGASGPAKPPVSRARLLKDAEAEEARAEAAREEEQGRAKRAGEKLLQLKSQRAQVESKLVEWEATFRRTHEREPTAADKQRSSQHKELTKLIADLDRFISAAESGAPPPGGQLAGEREAERGKLKSKMRRWDRDFERERGRRPREEDRAASEEFLGLRSRLQVLDESGDVSSRSNASAGPAVGGGGGLSAAAAAAAAAAGSDGLLLGGVSEAAHRLNPGGWWGGGEYYQLVISRVASRDAAHGFDQVRNPNPNPNP